VAPRNRLTRKKLSPAADYLVGCCTHSFRQSKQIVLTDPVLERVRKLAQLDGAAAHFILESRLNGHHDLLLGRDGLWGPTIRYEKCTQSSCQSARDVEAFLREFDMSFTARVFWRIRQLLSASTTWHSRSSQPESTRLAGNGLAGQIARCTNGGLVCHCTAMTSPCLVSSARADGAIRHNPSDPHQMAARTAQWRRRPPTSWREPHQFADRRHRSTVCALSACDINKSGGLAEKNSARCGVIARADSTKQTEDSYVSCADATSRC
jgi:hypothetical protein